MMNDNRGVTLVEIIVVIAIIAILAGGVIFSSGAISNWQLNNGAKSFEMVYGKSRLQAMVKADTGGMTVYKKEGKVTFGIVTKEEMNNSSFDAFVDETSINSRILVTVTLEEVGGTGLTIECPLSTLGSIRPISPGIVDGELNIGAIKFRKGTGAQLPITYTTNLGPGVSGEYLITKVVLELKGEKIVYQIEPATGTFTKE